MVDGSNGVSPSLFDVIDSQAVPNPPPRITPTVQHPKAVMRKVETEKRKLEPQPGFQMNFLSSSADIVIGGGGAGVGKTLAMFLEATRNLSVKGFGAVLFRRETPMITNEGALWDESVKLFSGVAKPNLNDLSWTFPPFGTRIRMSHMQLAEDRFGWDGAQIPLIGWDQLEQFLEVQFWYMLSRNRSLCGVIPYVRATCNPVPETDKIGGWLRKLIAWWIDPKTGLPIPERSGVVRWLVRVNDVVHWSDSREELISRFPTLAPEDVQPKSFTFIAGRLEDNQILLKGNPEYRASLLALPLHERERLLGGNWNSMPVAGKIFNRTWFKSILRTVPQDVIRWVRYWDKAGTEGGGKYSAGLLLGKRANGRTLVANVVRGQWSSHNRETMIKQTAETDRASGLNVEIWIEQEPGSGGKESAENTVLNLGGHTIHCERVTGAKVVRAGPFSSQAEAGNVDILADLGATIEGQSALEAFLSEAQNFDGVNGFSDQIDAASGAYNKLYAKAAASAGTW